MTEEVAQVGAYIEITEVRIAVPQVGAYVEIDKKRVNIGQVGAYIEILEISADAYGPKIQVI